MSGYPLYNTENPVGRQPRLLIANFVSGHGEGEFRAVKSAWNGGLDNPQEFEGDIAVVPEVGDVIVEKYDHAMTVAALAALGLRMISLGHTHFGHSVDGLPEVSVGSTRYQHYAGGLDSYTNLPDVTGRISACNTWIVAAKEDGKL